MKRVFALFLVVVMLVPLFASAETLEELLESVYGDQIQSTVLGDRLILMGEYDLFTPAEGDTSEFEMPENFNLEDVRDYLRSFNSILLLTTKNGVLYLGADVPLKDGEIVEGEGSPLMSLQFLAENMTFGN